MRGAFKTIVIVALIALALAGSAQGQSCPARKSGTSNGRIIGGVPADIRNWPGMVVLRTKIDWQGENGLGLTNHYFCGGTLINAQWVLTAAHCVFGLDERSDFVKISDRWVADKSSWYVPGAALEIVENVSDLRGASAPLHPQRIVRHAGYNPSTFQNDIALIKLRTPARGPAMRIAAAVAADPSVANGLDVWVAGFGKITNAYQPKIFTLRDQGVGTGGSNVLQEAGLPVRPNFAECVRAHPEFPLNPARQICAGLLKQDPNRPKDSCGGDSGGPLVRIAGNNCPIQVGLVSFGPSTCGEANRPALYTRVSSYNRWIRAVMGDAQITEVRDNGGAVAVPPVEQIIAALAPSQSGGRSNSGPAIELNLEPSGPVTVGAQRQVRVTARRVSGYVIVGDVDADGRLTYLAPNNWEQEPKLLNAGESTVFGAVDQPYKLTATRPIGRGYVFAVISPDKSLANRLRLGERARSIGRTRGFVVEERGVADDEVFGIAETILRGQAQSNGRRKWVFGSAVYEIVE